MRRRPDVTTFGWAQGAPTDREFTLHHPGWARSWTVWGGRVAWENGPFWWRDGEQAHCLHVHDASVSPTPMGWIYAENGPDPSFDPRPTRWWSVQGRQVSAIGQPDRQIEGLRDAIGHGFGDDHGWVWKDSGFWYRRQAGVVTVLGASQPTDAIAAVGPFGQLLVGGPNGARLAPAHRRLRAVAPIERAESVKWHRDGSVSGQDWLIDINGVRSSIEHPSAGDGASVQDHKLVGADGQVLQTGLGRYAWARKDHLLAGPGGACWNLKTGAHFQTPIGDGVVVATDDLWVSVSSIRGDITRFNPHTSERGVTDSLALTGDETVMAGVWAPGARTPGPPSADATLIFTTENRTFRLDKTAVVAVEPVTPAHNPPTTQRPSDPVLRRFPVRYTAEFNGRQWWWSRDGLLLSKRVGQ